MKVFARRHNTLLSPVAAAEPPLAQQEDPHRAEARRAVVGTPSSLDDDAFAREVELLGLPDAMASLIPRDLSPTETVTAILRGSKLFDDNWYFTGHPEIVVGGLDLCVHFSQIGWRDGAAPSFYFDTLFYRSQMPTDEVGRVNPLLHYLYVGEAKGLKPMRHFDPVWYRDQYGVVAQSPLCHYLRNLDTRRFSPSAEFDVGYYLDTNPDVRASDIDPLRHYVTFGQGEGRQATAAAANAELTLILASGLFDAKAYGRAAGLSESDDVSLARHYIAEGAAAGLDPNPLFDSHWYLQRHREAIGDARNPLVHYVTEGWHQLFDPHPLFSVGFYLDQNADVRGAGREPLAHYLESGGREGRAPCDEFDGNYYLTHYRDVATSGQNPLVHYLSYGVSESRNPSANFDTAWYLRHISKDPSINPLVHFRALDPEARRRAVPRSIRLDAAYTMSESDLDAWTDHLAALATRGEVRGKVVEPFVVVRWGRSPESCVGIASADAEMTLNEALSAVRSDGDRKPAVYLVCGPDDVIDDRFALAAAATMADGGLLGVVDAVYRRGDRWAANLLPGANATLITSVDASLSRFLISASLLQQIDLAPTSTPYDVLKAALTQLRAHGDLPAFRHAAWPLLRCPDLSQDVATARQVLARTRETRPPRLAKTPRSVSVVICTKDRGHLLSQLLDGLIRLPRHTVADIVVVANPPARSHAERVHALYAAHERITFVRQDGPYNFSAQSNRGAKLCRGQLLLFLNDDIVPVGSDWLEALAAPFERREVGIVAPLLLYPDETVQHAGMFLGFNDCAGHAMRGAHVSDDDCMFAIGAPRNVTAVTGAALMTPRALFFDLNGFDRQLGTYLQDVDYCLRVRHCDREIVYEPASLLFHMESASMRDVVRQPAFNARRTLEHRHFHRKWERVMAAPDEFHNPNLDIGDESLRTLRRRLA